MANVVEILVKGKDQFSGTAKSAQTSAGGLKGAMGGLGKMALGVGAGFIAAQASIAGVQKIMSASIGAAMKFEHQMAQIRALTGATTKDTDFLESSIKDMARAMPKSPAELGAGAYFILSSGIEDAADAADVLEVAAKASTIGLGETATVADALTTVLNAYGMSADKAGHVTDVMIEAVKQGKAEAGAFAGVLGRVVPLAAEMGISFEEVAANLATFTRLGVSAEEAATGLRSVMVSLKKPSQEAEEQLAAMGTSAQEVREQIREKGLLATLAGLMEGFEGNEEAITAVFGNIRALTSVLGTAGVQLDSYRDILGATESATGNLEKGFGIMADTAQFKTKVALSKLNVTLMELGQKALPIVARAADHLAQLIEKTEQLVGPVEDLYRASNLSASAAERADTSFSLWDLTMGAITLDFARAKKEVEDLAGVTNPLSDEIERQTAILRKDVEALRDGAETSQDLAEETSVLDGYIKGLSSRLGLSEEALKGSGLSMKELREETKGLNDIASLLPTSWAGVDRAIAASDAIMVGFAEDMRDEVGPGVTDALGAIAEEAGVVRNALTDMFRETTAEEADAEAALAAYKYEALELESRVGSLTGVEAARRDLLNNELIPAEEANRDLLRAQRDAAEAHATAVGLGHPTMDQLTKDLAAQTTQAAYLGIALGQIPSTIDVKIALGLAKTAELDLIKQALGAGLPIWPAQHGYHGDVTRPTMFLAGEGSQKERVDITPGGGQGAGRTVAIHLHIESLLPPNEMQIADAVEQLLPQIRRAVAA